MSVLNPQLLAHMRERMQILPQLEKTAWELLQEQHLVVAKTEEGAKLDALRREWHKLHQEMESFERMLRDV